MQTIKCDYTTGTYFYVISHIHITVLILKIDFPINEVCLGQFRMLHINILKIHTYMEAHIFEAKRGSEEADETEEP